jgi:hypothetical protein
MQEYLIITDFGEPLISRLLSLLLHILNWELELEIKTEELKI